MLFSDLREQFLNSRYSWIEADKDNAKRIVKYLAKRKENFVCQWDADKTTMTIIMEGHVSIDRMDNKLDGIQYRLSKCYMEQGIV